MTVYHLCRRRFLELLVAVGAVLPERALMAAPVERNKQPLRITALGPYLDTLLPEDRMPSATQLGTDRALLAAARAHRQFGRLIVLGCAWLDKQARDAGAPSFATLEESVREAIVARAAEAAADTLPRDFFDQTRRQAFLFYYSRPASWKEVGYTGPPQPVGFPDYTDPHLTSVE